MTKTLLELKNLSKYFSTDGGMVEVLRDINIEILENEFFAIVGPSGCGKSTLLRIIASIIDKSSGEINWKEDTKIGFVFQNYALFPYLKVYENVGFGLRMEGVNPTEIKKKVNLLIKAVGLEGFENHYPKELSGGMKQRVGLARALAAGATVLILDEPFSSLDEFSATSLRKLLLSLWKNTEITVIMVTHLISEATEMADRILVMAPNPGRVEKILENNIPRPRDIRSKQFFEIEDKIKNLMSEGKKLAII